MLLSKGLPKMLAGRTRGVGSLAIVLGVLLGSTALADDSIVTGSNAAATAQVHFQIIIPEEISAVFQAGGDSTPMVYSNAGSFTYTLSDAQASNYEFQSQLATIAVP